MNDNIVYIDGVGYCKVITINRYNQDGVNEPYDIYEPVESIKLPVESK